MLDVSASCACDCEDGNVPDNRAQYRARASVINLRKTRVGAAVSAANAVILLHEGDVEASTITTWLRLIAPLARPITVEVCIGRRLLPGVGHLWPDAPSRRGGRGRRGRPLSTDERGGGE